MPERKCDYPAVIKSAGEGKVTCHDKFFIGFKLKGNCPSCPKATSFVGRAETRFYDNRTKNSPAIYN